jgi:hypothetical protein
LVTVYKLRAETKKQRCTSRSPTRNFCCKILEVKGKIETAMQSVEKCQQRNIVSIQNNILLAGYMNFGPRVFRPKLSGPVQNSGDFSAQTESPIGILAQFLNKFNKLISN